MRRWGPFAIAALLLELAGACSPTPGPTAGSESHFLFSCDEGCGDLSCVCGICTTTCTPGDSCRELGAASLCVTVADRPADAACDNVSVAAFCDLPCFADADCQLAGAGFFCREGYCREDPFSTPDEPMPGFGALCEAVTCSTATQAPSLVGSYTGEGQVVLSSNPLWDVGNTESLSVDITDQNGDTVSGNLTLDTFAITVTGAIVRGEGGAFTIYGTEMVVDQDCNLEARVAIDGVVDESTVPATLTGTLALRFTGNFDGAGCTAEQRETYPGTGANFEHAETRIAP